MVGTAANAAATDGGICGWCDRTRADICLGEKQPLRFFNSATFSPLLELDNTEYDRSCAHENMTRWWIQPLNTLRSGLCNRMLVQRRQNKANISLCTPTIRFQSLSRATSVLNQRTRHVQLVVFELGLITAPARYSTCKSTHLKLCVYLEYHGRALSIYRLRLAENVPAVAPLTLARWHINFHICRFSHCVSNRRYTAILVHVENTAMLTVTAISERSY